MYVHVRHAAVFSCSVLYRRLRHVAEELTTDEQAIWAAQARVSDSTAMETLLMPLPMAVAVQARELAGLPGPAALHRNAKARVAVCFGLIQSSPFPARTLSAGASIGSCVARCPVLCLM